MPASATSSPAIEVQLPRADSSAATPPSASKWPLVAVFVIVFAALAYLAFESAKTRQRMELIESQQLNQDDVAYLTQELPATITTQVQDILRSSTQPMQINERVVANEQEELAVEREEEAEKQEENEAEKEEEEKEEEKEEIVVNSVVKSVAEAPPEVEEDNDSIISVDVSEPAARRRSGRTGGGKRAKKLVIQEVVQAV